MPRQVERIRVLALDVGNMRTWYVTEHRACYESPHRFMCSALLNPHKEGYDVRHVRFDSWDADDNVWNDITEEEFDNYFDEVKGVGDIWFWSDIEKFKTAFDTLFYRGAGIWDI
jgi:hypothetical protein